jgi:hypothetical protein
MGRRNTQLGPTLHQKQKLKALARLDQPERYPGWVLVASAKQIGSPGEVLADQLVLVQPEMEGERSSLVSIPPLRAGIFKRAKVLF